MSTRWQAIDQYPLKEGEAYASLEQFAQKCNLPLWQIVFNKKDGISL